MNTQIKNQNSVPDVDKVPMAVYPLNSSAKLDQEPNPFEKSFSAGVSTDNKLKLPPVASITSPSPMAISKDISNPFTWESLRTGPLSPSMLQGPVHQPSDEYTTVTTTNLNVSSSYPVKVEEGLRPSSYLEEDQLSLESSESSTNKRAKKGAKKRQKASDPGEDGDKRKHFLERNRIAALKCRQRKKQWLNNLQSKVEFLAGDNERLQLQSEALKEEIVNLKTLLLAHKDCPTAQANGFNANSIHKSISMLASTSSSSSIGFQPYLAQQPSSSNGIIRF